MAKIMTGLAISTTWNERGLEAPFYSCYVDALQTSLGLVSNRYTASTQTALYIPGPQMNAFKHKCRGQELEQAQEDIFALVEVGQPESQGKRHSDHNRIANETKLHKILTTHTAAVAAWTGEKTDNLGIDPFTAPWP